MKMLLLVLVGSTLCSCSQHFVRVLPYERKHFADPLMDPGLDPLLLTMTQHAYFSREGSFGGGGIGGGGCGCN
ncbi:DUF4266 domain-containing protein [Prosthecobacter dejongeii]|uniref:DUF4266 domain-containing protein n=1 Tax=Prosthecobacter dejongeii TaxID=48465 RepID=A0A7W7YGU8_9BACT|nr:DUF4266 domain-containing protein [Prosthecobacter dejongeii]MBB5035893.1 hypothetical protein [Prosthecobacter dejongeii]